MTRCRSKFMICGWLLGGLLALLAAIAWIMPARADSPAGETSANCLSCHNNPDLALTLGNGESISLYVSTDQFTHSVHTQVGIECLSCHPELEEIPHPKRSYADRREFSLQANVSCQKCHSAIYEKTTDSMHAKAAQLGNAAAPVCTNCHGAHDVRSPDQPRAHISQTCSQCHGEIFSEYQASVHGAALIEENNPDVPVCTDCHGVHNIHDPREAMFRIQSPELCANCHANAKLMGKYNLPSNVYNLYKLSWHGVDVSVYKPRWPTIWHDSAVCTDCHSVHNIRRTNDAQSSVNPANLRATCLKCHPDAGNNWTGAWTGHNEISAQRTPFVFFTKEFYSTFVWVMLWVSIIYVTLQIIHATVDRVRRSLR